jgi:hypothetical protein
VVCRADVFAAAEVSRRRRTLKINWLRAGVNGNSEIADGRWELIRGSLHRSTPTSALLRRPNCVRVGTKTAVEVRAWREFSQDISRQLPSYWTLLVPPPSAFRSIVITVVEKKSTNGYFMSSDRVSTIWIFQTNTDKKRPREMEEGSLLEIFFWWAEVKRGE